MENNVNNEYPLYDIQATELRQWSYTQINKWEVSSIDGKTIEDTKLIYAEKLYNWVIGDSQIA